MGPFTRLELCIPEGTTLTPPHTHIHTQTGEFWGGRSVLRGGAGAAASDPVCEAKPRTEIDELSGC